MTAAGDATSYTGFVSFLVVWGCMWGCYVISVWPGARIHNFLALDSGTILGWELLTIPYSARCMALPGTEIRCTLQGPAKKEVESLTLEHGPRML